MLRRLTLLTVLAIALTPAEATASPQDVAATHAYIQANYTLAKASVARISAGEARIANLNATLAHECPGIGAGSPEDAASEPLGYEVAVALWSIAYGTAAGPIRTFVAATKRLHWSNRRITKLAERYSSSLHGYATLPQPDLCGDVESWKASGFQTVPATTTRAVAQEQAINLEALPSGLLARYERGNDARVLARTEALEIKLEENEFTVGQTDWYLVLETLDLNP